MTAECVKQNADILDVCCGGRQFWYDKDREDVIYMDIRQVPRHEFYPHRYFEVNPDVVGDYTRIPFDDGRFRMVVFDPPHLTHGSGIMNLKYGKLEGDWKSELAEGFRECMRALQPKGFLVFKWSEADVALSEITPLFPCQPLFGSRTNTTNPTVWLVFMKEVSA